MEKECSCKKKTTQSHTNDKYTMSALVSPMFVKAAVNQLNLKMRSQLGGWLNKEMIQVLVDMLTKMTGKYVDHVFFSTKDLREDGGLSVRCCFNNPVSVGVAFLPRQSITSSMFEGHLPLTDEMPDVFDKTELLSSRGLDLLSDVQKILPYAHKTGWREAEVEHGVKVVHVKLCFEIERARQIWTVTPPGHDMKINDYLMVVYLNTFLEKE